MVYGKLTGNKNAAVLNDQGLDTSIAAVEKLAMSNKDSVKLAAGADFSDVAAEAQSASLALEQLQSYFDKTKLSSQELAKPIDDVKIALESLVATEGYSLEKKDKLILDLENLRVEIEQEGKITDQTKTKIQKYVNELVRLSNIASNIDENTTQKVLADGGNSAQKIKNEVDFNQTQVNRAEENAKASQQGIDYQQEIKGVLDTLNAVQQLTFA